MVSSISGGSVAPLPKRNPGGETEILQKLLVVEGEVAMDLDLNRVNGTGIGSKVSRSGTMRFKVAANSFFTVLVLNDTLRGPEPGSMGLVAQSPEKFPDVLRIPFQRLVIEKLSSEEEFDLVVRDAKTGFVFFSIDGHQYDYDAAAKSFEIKEGRLLISKEFAAKLGHPSATGTVAGSISLTTRTSPIEVTTVVDGAVQSATMPALRIATASKTSAIAPHVGTVPGPDVIVGDLPVVSQGGSSGNFVGLGVATSSCNAGTIDLDWFKLPNNDHPVIPQNMYRMSGGANNTDRFEQIGQSWLKHAFQALTEDICSYGCNGVGNTHLGSGCSDPYSASLNYGQSGLGSRAWVNPFTGAFPRGDSATPPADHTAHTAALGQPHTGTSHRLLVAMSDLNPTTNAGATYFAEAQYVTPHEYAWCQSHPGECNMYNNVSYRRFTVTGTTTFTFTPAAPTVRMTPAVYAWTGATVNMFEPDPGHDGIAHVGYKVTNPSAGVWHYEYAVYNQTLDRAIQSFSVPLGCGITVSNLGFHAPPQHPGWAADGTVGNTGYSSTPWTSSQTFNALSWNSETFAQNQNANAIRWGTMYNFRFDSNRPPQATNATIGFFKTGAPITVAVQGPTPDTCNALQVTTAVSRKIHGDAGPFDIDLPLSGEPGIECRSGGVNGDHTLVITFSNNVVSGNATVTTGAGSVSGSPTFSGNMMTVNLTGITEAEKVVVTLSGVTDSFTQVLSDTTVSMNALVGDTTANKSVSSSDVAQTKSQSGMPIDSSNFREDVVANGSINSSDIAVVKSRSGSGL